MNALGFHFYPRPPRGGRPWNSASILCPLKAFLSTSSARRTTKAPEFCIRIIEISIHVLREEDDVICRAWTARSANFYPRPPRGGRHVRARVLLKHINFYPRPPRGGRPPLFALMVLPPVFLSTSSARRTTAHFATSCADTSNFYPRPPRGGRRAYGDHLRQPGEFLSTSSARRTTERSQGHSKS